MTTVQEKLESLFAKLRTLLQARQEAAAEALAETTEEPYRLSDEELAVLRPALERTQNGELAGNTLTSGLLTKPWR